MKSLDTTSDLKVCVCGGGCALFPKQNPIGAGEVAHGESYLSPSLTPECNPQDSHHRRSKKIKRLSAKLTHNNLCLDHTFAK